MSQQEIHLAHGEMVVAADVNGFSLDGSHAHAYVIPPGQYASFAEYIQAGYEVPVFRTTSGWVEEQKGEQ